MIETNQHVFWRADPLTLDDQKLLRVLKAAHHRSCSRSNYSSMAAANTARSSGSFAQALASAILTTGFEHAPLEETYKLLTFDNPGAFAAALLAEGKTVPGWGGSFVKAGERDPIWIETEDLIRELSPALSNIMDAVTKELKEKGILPNPSAFTACVAIILRMPAKASPWLFFASRLNGWSALIFSNLPD